MTDDRTVRATAWPSGWTPYPDPPEHDGFLGELRREMSPAHILQGAVLKGLGRYEAADDFLFGFEDGRVALVHLTWVKETLPDFPSTTLYPSFQTWVESWTAQNPDDED